jgi:hypothetical protein
VVCAWQRHSALQKALTTPLLFAKFCLAVKRFINELSWSVVANQVTAGALFQTIYPNPRPLVFCGCSYKPGFSPSSFFLLSLI